MVAYLGAMPVLVPRAGSLQQHFRNFRVLGCSLDQQVAYLQRRSAVTLVAWRCRRWEALVDPIHKMPTCASGSVATIPSRNEDDVLLRVGCRARLWLLMAASLAFRAYYGAYCPRRRKSLLVPRRVTPILLPEKFKATRTGKKQKCPPKGKGTL